MSPPVATAGSERLAALARRRAELGDAAPRIALFLFDSGDEETLRKTLDRIPDAATDWLEEIVVMAGRDPLGDASALADRARVPLLVHRSPREAGHGAQRKQAFEYALRRGFDHALTLRGDGSHPPEALPDLLHAAVVEGHGPVFASRLAGWAGGAGPPGGDMPLARRVGHRLATAFQNRALGLRLGDYLTSYRLYPVAQLRHLPFQLDADDRRFDVEIVIQLRALGATVHEVPARPVWQEDPARGDELFHVLRACASAVDYRLHQLHVTRNGRYLVDHGIHYTLKLSRTGSHMQIVDAIEPGSRVLDLGCSQGLLARPLREKQVRVTGVDERPPERLADELDAYYQRDLEEPLELPTGRVFDYVVCADVIEHLRNRRALLRSARRYLREGGRLVISTPNIALWFYRLSLLVGRFEYGPRGVLDRTHVHLFTRSTFRREVERAGFFVLEERVTALPFEVVFESTGRSRLVRAVNGAYHLLARAWPEMFAYQHILEAEITTLDEEATEPRTGS